MSKKNLTSVPVTVRISTEAFERLSAVAEARFLTTNQLMSSLLEAYSVKLDVKAEVERGLGV